MEKFQPGVMLNRFPDDTYSSPSRELGFIAKHFPSLHFYYNLFARTTPWLAYKAQRGQCDDYAWCYASAWVLEDIEKVGIKVTVEGLEVFDSLSGPCVIVANHMSTLETYLLPCILRPRFPVTFVVKRSLTEIPLFGPIMRSRDPIVVDRKNPREDLTTILKDGCERLEKGTSVIVFPQSTRTVNFDPKHFNTIGCKLARRAKVPLVSVALKTDAWGQGRRIKELGKISPQLDVTFRFFPAMSITDTGHAEHKVITEAIAANLTYWTKREELKAAGGVVPPVMDPEFKLAIPETESHL